MRLRINDTVKVNFGNNKLLFLFYVVLIAYLVANTGIISDDFDGMARLKGENFPNILIPRGHFYFIETPVEYFTHYIWYYFFRVDSQIAANIFKIFYMVLAFYLISRFFSIYLVKNNAFLASFLFLFFPSHDSTVYFFMLQYLTLSFAFYLYAFYLAHNNRLVLAFLFAVFASFISYGSPALALALFVLFALDKEFKKGLVLLIPNILYSSYYLYISYVAGDVVQRLPKEINVYAIIKQFALQVSTFLDATIGPSMWLKIYYSFSQLKIASAITGFLLLFIFYRSYRESRQKYSAKLVLGLTVLAVGSFAMFAVTGYYPQLAFNLGNRATIFGSLLLTYLIVLMPVSHKLKTLIFAVMLFCILGISDHWKDWSLHQEGVIANMRNNENLKNYQGSKTIYVSGNQYSKFGPISHIEFLSENWVPNSIFALLFDKKITARSINKRHRYKNGYLVDTKYSRKTEVKDFIYVYDSETDELFKLNAPEINGYIKSLPPCPRHWIQIVDIKSIKKAILRLMPRLKYAF